ncbi:PorP/SprF family type IX secretion system membrane protein [Catalinimonas niigatensis]|uniref:PorP/SprF family type IX secretion system membrane protein n=1 Tax=Catalinimonas niigatensis TaxID=1397264 RepID=UPI002666C38A|nr:PorP/SprF family type IX secretion system membrane protein [Catalinimonas niigatensis]WPP49606.1 PorP/SprF family type IX secretion system membrane protein [Catalinimonas niigatensis]
MSFCCLLYGIWGEAQAQEVRFSQYQTVPLLTNPAFAGTQSDYALHLNYRMQNIGLLAYRTGYFSFTIPLYDQSQEPRQVGGLSLGAINDMAGEAGEIKTNGASLSGAYSVLFDRYGVQSLTFGLQGEYMLTSIDFGNLHWPSQITYYGFDPGRRPTDVLEGRSSFVRFNAGMIWSYNPGNNQLKAEQKLKLFGGFAVSNLNAPSPSFLQNGEYAMSLLYKIHGGAEVPLGNRLSLAPDFIVMMQNSLHQFTLGSLLNYEKEVRTSTNPNITKLNLFAGVWYRSTDAVVLLVGASNRKFNAAFSYDLNTVPAKAGINGQGAVELSLSFKFLKEKSPRKISSPLF